MLRGAAAAIVVATGAAASALGASAMRDKHPMKKADSARSTAAKPASPPDSTAGANREGQATAQPVTIPDSNSAAAASPTSAPKPVVARAAAPTPIVQMGSSSIAGGFAAERSDSAVTLSFDTPLARTRRPEKFEQFVRTTLRSIYGKKIDSALATMPSGSLARQGDLLTELPARGMRIPIDSAWEIRVFPQTRKGVEGPLVVSYRASAVAR